MRPRRDIYTCDTSEGRLNFKFISVYFHTKKDDWFGGTVGGVTARYNLSSCSFYFECGVREPNEMRFLSKLVLFDSDSCLVARYDDLVEYFILDISFQDY